MKINALARSQMKKIRSKYVADDVKDALANGIVTTVFFKNGTEQSTSLLDRYKMFIKKFATIKEKQVAEEAPLTE